MTRRLRVGELARRSGVSVRALHWYEEIGLLAPERSGAGYRLYGPAQVERLHAIVSLRALGLSTGQIRAALDGPQGTLGQILGQQIEQLEAEIGARQRLRRQLQALQARIAATGEAPVDDLLKSMEMIVMVEKYYSEEQLAQLSERRSQVGDERIREVEVRWPQLIAEVQAAVAAGEDPCSARGAALAAEWNALIEEFTGGDAGIRASLQRMYENEPEMRSRAGLDPAVAEWIARASEPA